MTPSLEELSELEVELPARCRTPLRINLVEPIPYVYAQGSKRAQGAHPEAEAAEQTARVELSRLVPDVAALEEGVQIQRLIHPQPKFGRPHEVRITERRSARLRLIGVRVEAVWRNGELVVPTQRLAVLGAAERERLGVEERARIPKQRTRLGGQSGHDHHRLAAEDATTEATNRRVGAQLGRIPLEGSRATQRSTIELRIEGLQSTVSRERQTRARVVLCGETKRRPEAALTRFGDGSEQALVIVPHPLAAVGDEEPRVDRLRHREAQLDLAARPDRRAEVGQLEARTAMVRREATRDARLTNVGIAVSGAEIVDEATEIPL